MIEAMFLGVPEAAAFIQRLQDSVAGLSDQSIAVGTDIIYAYGIETGRRASGRLARRAGGSFALTGAFEAAIPDVAPAVAAAMPLGRNAVRQVLTKVATDIQGGTAANEPRLTGTLAASFAVIPGWR